MRVMLLVLALALSGCLRGDSPEPTARQQEVVTEWDPVSFTQDVRVPLMFGQGRIGETDAIEVRLNLTDHLPAGASWRDLDAIEATLAWTNTPNAGADLAIGLRFQGYEAHGRDQQQLALDGAHEETVTLGATWPGDVAHHLATDVHAVVSTDWAALSANGFNAKLHVTLHF